jgi:hypothetical protein
LAGFGSIALGASRSPTDIEVAKDLVASTAPQGNHDGERDASNSTPARSFWFLAEDWRKLIAASRRR